MPTQHKHPHLPTFDPTCRQCLHDQGLDGVIRYLDRCAEMNLRARAKEYGPALSRALQLGTLANEQRRVAEILRELRTVMDEKAAGVAGAAGIAEVEVQEQAKEKEAQSK